jgi:hypothetical protein
MSSMACSFAKKSKLLDLRGSNYYATDRTLNYCAKPLVIYRLIVICAKNKCGCSRA